MPNSSRDRGIRPVSRTGVIIKRGLYRNIDLMRGLV
jgi:hypothetical protein